MRIPSLPKPVRIIFFIVALLIATRMCLAILDGILTPTPDTPQTPTAKYVSGQNFSDLTTAKEVLAYYQVNTGTYDLIAVPKTPNAPQSVIVDVSSRTFATWLSDNPTVVLKHYPSSAFPSAAQKNLSSTPDKATSYTGAPVVRTTVNVIDAAGSYVGEHFLQIASLAIMILLIVGMRSIGSDTKKGDQLLLPQNIKGSLDENIIGMADIKREIRRVSEMLAQRTKYADQGVASVANIMFTGPPGTGKSKIAALMAKELGAPLLHCSGSNLETGLVGGGSRALKDLYNRALALSAQHGVCVVFLDEAQSLFMQRGLSGPHTSKHTDDTANAFLTILDGVVPNIDHPVVWIVATNFSQDDGPMDAAMLRRFAHKINFRLPNKAERKELLTFFLKKKGTPGTKPATLESKTLQLVNRVRQAEPREQTEPNGLVQWEDLNMDQIADVTAELAPAILEDIVSGAKVEAISTNKRINTSAMMAAFERSVIGLTDRETTAELIKTRTVVAYHELGHFTLELYHALQGAASLEQAFERLRTIKISTESVSRMGALGYVLSRQDDAKLQSRERLEHMVMGLYGGVACEEIKYGQSSITTGSHDDIKRATNLLVTAVSQLGMYSHVKLNLIEANRLGLKFDSSEKVTERSSALYEATLAIVETWMPLIEELAPILLDKYVLTRDDAIAHLTQSSVFKDLAAPLMASTTIQS